MAMKQKKYQANFFAQKILIQSVSIMNLCLKVFQKLIILSCSNPVCHVVSTMLFSFGLGWLLCLSCACNVRVRVHVTMSFDTVANGRNVVTIVPICSKNFTTAFIYRIICKLENDIQLHPVHKHVM